MARVLPLLLVACLAVLAAGNKSLEGYKVYRLQPITTQQFDVVRALQHDSELDFWSASDVMVSPASEQSFLDLLDSQNIPYETLVTDVQMTIDAEKMRQMLASRSADGRAISFTQYNRYDAIQSYLAELARDYPDVVTVGSIGTSSEGRSIPLIKISTGGSNKPVVLVDAGIHAREWIAPAMALYIIQQLVENPSNNDLIANVDWHIVPLLNPDGYEYSHTNYRLWRKTRSETTRCTGQSDAKNGVDANRNFDFHWMEVGASSSPCSDTYAGTQGFSEPETASLRDYVLSTSNIQLYLTFHSYGNYLLYPWGYTSSLPADWRDLDDLARKANSAQVAAGGSSYAVGSSTNVLYAAAGGSDDWVKGVGGVDLSYTVELPGGGYYGFDLPASSIARTVSVFWPAVRVFGEAIAN